MKTFSKRKIGAMLVKSDKAWGIAYEDGHSTSMGWISPIEAEMHDPKYYKTPQDLCPPCSNRNRTEMMRGRLVLVEKIITVKILE
jgi:hypothetical protein